MKNILKILIALLILIPIALINIKDTGDPFKNGSLFKYAEIDYRVAKMSLKEKIGQMIIVDFRNYDEIKNEDIKTPLSVLPHSYKDAIASLNLGGIILFSEAADSSTEIVKLIDDAQTARTGDLSLNKIPLLVAIDQEGGSITRLNCGTNFPGNMALAATANPEFAYLEGKVISEELNALGINTNFAPVTDINSNPLNPIIGIRSYSDNPLTVYEFSKEFIEGQNENNIISTVKHFPGHGDTDTDSHTGLPVVYKTYEELQSFELVPFKNLINDGIEMILTAHIEYPLIDNSTVYSSILNEDVIVPATLSKTILTDILRDDLGFNGVVISDSLVMDAIDTYFSKEEAAKHAINAGVDMLLMPVQIECAKDLETLEEYINSIEKMVIDGEISEKTINQHVKRILTLKSRHNLLEYDSPDTDEMILKAVETVNSKEHHDIEYTISKNAITEYKNEDILPLNVPDNSKITILYPYNSNYLPLFNGFETAKEKGYLNDTVEINYLKFDGSSSIKDFKRKLKDTDYLIVISAIYYPKELDIKTADGKRLDFILKIIDLFNSTHRKVIAVSAELPYDVKYLSNADAIILLYNSMGYYKNSEEYNGDIPSSYSMFEVAIEKIFEGDFKGTSPVNLNE